MFHIITHDPQQTFGTHQEILSINKICFRQILKSVKIIRAPQITYRITRLKISGRGALVNGGFCIGELGAGARESLFYVSPCLWPRRLTYMFAIKGFLSSGWAGQQKAGQISGREKNEDRIFISTQGSLELAVSLQEVMASLKVNCTVGFAPLVLVPTPSPHP